MRLAYITALSSLLIPYSAFAADTGTYRPGKSYHSVQASNPNDCAAQCKGDAQCKGWNFIRPRKSVRSGVCEFNSEQVSPVPSAISESGSNDTVRSSPRIVSSGTNTVRVGNSPARQAMSSTSSPAASTAGSARSAPIQYGAMTPPVSRMQQRPSMTAPSGQPSMPGMNRTLPPGAQGRMLPGRQGMPGAPRYQGGQIPQNSYAPQRVPPMQGQPRQMHNVPREIMGQGPQNYGPRQHMTARGMTPQKMMPQGTMPRRMMSQGTMRPGTMPSGTIQRGMTSPQTMPRGPQQMPRTYTGQPPTIQRGAQHPGMTGHPQMMRPGPRSMMQPAPRGQNRMAMPPNGYPAMAWPQPGQQQMGMPPRRSPYPGQPPMMQRPQAMPHMQAPRAGQRTMPGQYMPGPQMNRSQMDPRQYGAMQAAPSQGLSAPRMPMQQRPMPQAPMRPQSQSLYGSLHDDVSTPAGAPAVRATQTYPGAPMPTVSAVPSQPVSSGFLPSMAGGYPQSRL